MYTVKVDNQIDIKRLDDKMLELSIDGKKAKILTEDLAAICASELPNDVADNLFAKIEEKNISKGKMRVCVNAKTDIKKGDRVMFTIDVTRYLDKANKFTGVRTNNFGFIY